MVSYRYWFDTTFSNVVYVPISPNASSVTILDGLNMTQIPKGMHQVNFQFKDSLDMWSVVSVDSVMKESLPVANFSYSQIDYCDSTVVTFTDMSIDGDLYHWNFGDGDTSNVAEPTHAYLTPGTYTVTQMVNDPIAGLDSTISLTITIDTTATFASIFVLECDSYVSPSGNYTWLTNGTYQDTISNTAGCDSVITVNLTIHNSTMATVNPTVCDEYTASSGVQYTSTGIYQDTVTNSIGCDSIITINLTVWNSTTSQETVSSCGSYTSPSSNYTWTSSGTYYDTLTNSLGCDSVITVILTILQSTTVTVNPVVCDEYISPSGITWNVSGNYMDTIPNTVGCDSIITINLTVLNSTAATLTETACFSYVSPSGNEVWTSTGTYVDTLQNSNGCDSVITVNLTINTVDTLVTESGFTLTANSSTGNYQWLDCSDMQPISGENGQSFTATISGNYALEIDDNGCTDTSSCHSIVNVGIEENSLGGEIVVYPNPTSGEVTIKVPDNLEKIEILVWDVNGKLLNQFTVNQTSSIKVEITGAPGLYFIEINSGKGKARLAVIKQ
jgi:PKD repeat protein